MKENDQCPICASAYAIKKTRAYARPYYCNACKENFDKFGHRCSVVPIEENYTEVTGAIVLDDDFMAEVNSLVESDKKWTEQMLKEVEYAHNAGLNGLQIARLMIKRYPDNGLTTGSVRWQVQKLKEQLDNS